MRLMYTTRTGALSTVEMPYYRPRDLHLLLHNLLTDLVISHLTSPFPILAQVCCGKLFHITLHLPLPVNIYR